ncbi:hypothetical protein NW762_001707 [Fusarium torreyae]|uniref:Uncharacterized protein n=1 Tax=Fusarium torreyae TaxID=1237075 RepID=A0A9W8VP59_9HYPO|nr:hypothetical protein NW762_001707 [Fusarium torreyae]
MPSVTISTDSESIDILEDRYIRESGAIELITEHNEQQPLPTSFANDRANVARFQERMLAAVTELVDYPRRIPYPNYKQMPRDRRAMSTAFYTIFNTSSPSSITNLLLRTIPLRVQDVLGKSEPKFGDLISLPEPTSEERACWLVYFDGTVRWQMEDVPDDPFVRRKTTCVARRGKYVGSSVDFRGGGVRLDRHTVAAKTKHGGERRQLHHHELCQEGTETNLRVLAVFDRDPRSKPYVPLLETIFMALLGTFAGRESTGRHNPEPCYELYDKIRSCMGIPDIEGDGLNKALSIHQGMIHLNEAIRGSWKREIQSEHEDVKLATGILRNTSKSESQTPTQSSKTEGKSANNTSYGWLQEMRMFMGILHVQHHESPDPLLQGSWQMRDAQTVLTIPGLASKSTKTLLNYNLGRQLPNAPRFFALDLEGHLSSKPPVVEQAAAVAVDSMDSEHDQIAFNVNIENARVVEDKKHPSESEAQDFASNLLKFGTRDYWQYNKETLSGERVDPIRAIAIIQESGITCHDYIVVWHKHYADLSALRFLFSQAGVHGVLPPDDQVIRLPYLFRHNLRPPKGVTCALEFLFSIVFPMHPLRFSHHDALIDSKKTALMALFAEKLCNGESTAVIRGI